MKAKYLGVPSPEDDGPRRVQFGGISFPRGLFVPVDGITPPSLLGKLRQHPNFEVSEDAMTKADEEALDGVNGSADEAEAPNGSADLPGDKASLLAALEALKDKHPDVKFDPRWGAPKLKAALEEAQFVYGDD